MTLVLATEWSVSTESFSALFSHRPPNEDERGVTLNVHRSDDTVLNQWGGMGITIRHPEHDGLKFDTTDEARAYARSVGLLKEYVR